VGPGSADGDLVEVMLGLLLSHGQTSIVRQDGENCESWVVLAGVGDGERMGRAFRGNLKEVPADRAVLGTKYIRHG
jgi:hypothetical protein